MTCTDRNLLPERRFSVPEEHEARETTAYFDDSLKRSAEPSPSKAIRWASPATEMMGLSLDCAIPIRRRKGRGAHRNERICSPGNYEGVHRRLAKDLAYQRLSFSGDTRRIPSTSLGRLFEITPARMTPFGKRVDRQSHYFDRSGAPDHASYTSQFCNDHGGSSRLLIFRRD